MNASWFCFEGSMKEFIESMLNGDQLSYHAENVSDRQCY